MKIKNSKKKFVAIAVCQLFFLTIGCGESVKPIDEPNNKIALVEIKKEPKIRFWYFLVSSCFFVDIVFGVNVDHKCWQY